MQFLPDISYPADEIPKLYLLEKLFRDWHQHFATNASVLERHAADDMVFDGFYPNYFSQKKRILFIGREARDIAGCNYIDLLYRAYRETKLIGTQHINRSKFHSRMMHIAYGIINGISHWPEFPYASEIGDTFGAENGMSMAFMNISKLSNETETWQSDWGAIDAAHDLSALGRSFNQEEIAILEPNIIITMNLGSKLASLGKLTIVHTSESTASYWLDNAGRRSLLIDTWHFSAPRKRAVRDYYGPICEAIRYCDTLADGLNTLA